MKEKIEGEILDFFFEKKINQKNENKISFFFFIFFLFIFRYLNIIINLNK